MSSLQYNVMLLAMVASLFVFMAWFMPAATTPPPEYVEWKADCTQSGGKLFRADSNTYCVYGRMELYGHE